MPDAPSHTPTISAVYPYLCVRGAEAAIAFYVRVFGAREDFRLTAPDGRIGHAELQLGPVTLMVVDEFPEYGILAPAADGRTGFRLHLHVDDVDAIVPVAVAAGATVLYGPSDEGHGERQCRLRDPFGHEWLLGHETEQVSREEMQRRYSAGG